MEMLYGCENVRTLTYGARLNLPPNAAFRAPGFVEGTFGLECLLDELAARLEIDPLELRTRNHADNDLADGRPYSSKNLLECYKRAEPHWARRDEVRARSAGPGRRGAGLARNAPAGGRPYSSKNLLECYKRAEPHWARRDEVRARSEGPVRRGVGLAS